MQGGQKTILVVDDEESIRRYVSETLTMHGYRAVAAGDAKTALGLVRDLGESLDLVVTDVVMPEMDGIEFADEVELLFPNLNVLYITAYPPRGGEHDADTLVKPFAPSELIDRVEKVLRHG